MKKPACHGLRIKYIMMELDEGVMGGEINCPTVLTHGQK
jgi:hypothetical protein